MGYNWQTAVEVLSEVEKNRIVCVYLNATIENSQVDWKKAANDFESASVEAFKKGISNSLKKLDVKGDDDGTDASPVKPSPAKGGGKKRKAAAATDGDVEDDAEAKPAPKKRGRPRKNPAPVAATEMEVEESVKVEENEE